MKYEIISTDTMTKMILEVNDYMEDGWKPQGGICAYVSSTYTRFLQAMVKEESNVLSED